MISIQSNCLLVITLCFLAGNVVFSQISFCFSTENGFVMVFLQNLCNFYDFMFPDCVFCIISVILIMCFYVQSSLWLPYCNKMCVCVCVCVCVSFVYCQQQKPSVPSVINTFLFHSNLWRCKPKYTLIA